SPSKATRLQSYDGDSSNGDDKRSSLSLVTPSLWKEHPIDKFTVRTLYEMFKKKARSMPTLERLSLGTAILTEAVIMAENPSSKIPRDRLQRYMNYRSHKIAWGKTAYRILMRSVKSLSASSWTGDSYEVSGFALAINLWAMSSVNVLGKSLGKPCETSSSSDPLCLHWDSTRTPTIAEVLELEKINNDKEQRKDKNHSMSNSEKLDKLIQMVLSIQEDGFRGSWYRAILEQNPTRVTGKKLRVSYKTMFNEDGVSPLKETIERSFIRPVPPECLNEGVVFKEGSVVDAYFNNGWWTGVIVVERPDGSFLVYFDDPPDIMRFIRSQLRPHADWIGSKWVKSKNKVLSQHMFTRGKLVEMTREISESEKEKIWVRALVITEVRKQGDDRRKFLIKRCTISQNSSDEAEGKHLIVDICKIRPSPPRDLCAEYSLNDYVEVVVTHGWRKGRVTEILLENKYKVYFAATKEDALWALSSVNQLGTFFGISDDGIQFPLCLHWKETKALTIEEVDVKCILGDPGLHSDLVEDVDCEFGRVVDLVKRGYRLKRQDWLNRSVDIAVAEAEVDENNSVPGIDATDQEKIEFLNNKVVSLEERVKYLEGLLNIRGETVKETEKSKETEAATKTKVNGQNADYELDENEVLGVYIDAKRKEIAKRKKNGVRPPREVGHQDEDDVEVEVNEGQTQEEEEQHQEDDAEVNEEQPQEEEEQQEEEDTEDDVDDGDKESENPETNEEQKQEEEEQQQEDDTEVNTDVDVGAKENGSENPVKGSKKRGRKDGEENEDAYEKPVKVTRKSERVTKGGEVNEDASEKPMKGTRKSKRGTKGGEVNEDASEKPMKGTRKSKRGTKDGEENEYAYEKPVKVTRKSERVTKGKKKGVTPPREVQQQVEDHAETNEDGEGNEDASKKHVKFTKKNGRGNKEHNVGTPKSKKQKKQFEKDSADDVIGSVLEDLKNAD
ncbi:hypothetical protein HID58_013703, partial [Brassica napus]